MSAPRTARARARAEITREITDAARRQLAESGAAALSLRAIARELGMVSSALYRYFPSRDDLLTALLIGAYDAIGASVETAVARADDPRAQWRAAAHAVREWGRAHPHEYALLYGSPVPGYAAPQTTVDPAARVPLAVLGIVERAWAAGTLAVPDEHLDPLLAEQIGALADRFTPGVPAPALARMVVAWTQLFGAVSFELNGQLVGSMDPAAAFFDYAVETMADLLGLRDV